MKKTFLTIILVASTFATCFGQYKIIDNNLVFDKYLVSLGHRGIGFLGKDNFLIGNRGKFFLINKEFSSAEQLKIKDEGHHYYYYDTDYSGRFSIFNKDGKIVEYSFIIKKDNLILTKKSSTGSGNNLAFKYENTTFSGFQKGDFASGMVATSQNEKHQVLIINAISKAYKYKGSIVFVFDDEGEILWKKQVQMNFKQVSFSLLDCAVSNDGKEVYIASESYSYKGNDKVNSTLEIKRVEEDEFANEEVIKNLDKKTVTNAKIIILSNDNVFLAANYEDDNDGGFFNLTFPKKDASDNTMNIVPYRKVIASDIRYKDFLPNMHTSLFKGVYETTDGIVSMITEEAADITFNNKRNVVINSFNLAGEYQKTSILFRKSSESYGTPVISVSVINAKDKLLLIYNENKDNLSTNSPDNAAFLAGGFKNNGMVALCEVVGGNIGNKYNIIDGKTSNLMFANILYVGDNFAMLKTMSYNTAPLKFGVCKLTWE